MEHPTASFLSLPEHIRVNIYQFAGLIRLCPIDISIPGNKTDIYRHVGCIEPRQRSITSTFPWDCCTFLVRLRLSFLNHLAIKHKDDGLGTCFSRPDLCCRTVGSDFRRLDLCFSLRLPLTLYTVSKAVHHEALNVFLAFNKFRLTVELDPNLSRFQLLAPKIAATIQFLHISIVNFNKPHGSIDRSPISASDLFLRSVGIHDQRVC